MAGIDYGDLRSILTLAANSAYDRLRTERDSTSRAYYEGVLKQIKALEEGANPQMDRIRRRRSGLPDLVPSPPTPAQRRARIQDARREEALLNDLVDQAVARRKKGS